MCDYCDCRSHPAIAELSADHDEILDSLRRARRAAALTDAATLADEGGRLARLLAAHADREERGVFAAVKDVGAATRTVAELEREHVALDALLAGLGGPDSGDALAEVERILDRHIAREESDVFPTAHQLLAPSRWDAVDQVHDQLRALHTG